MTTVKKKEIYENKRLRKYQVCIVLLKATTI